jgi:hypothetical protein
LEEMENGVFYFFYIFESTKVVGTSKEAPD